jgi:protein-S-isoprenylcysteine O-methyltransferase Ste14
MQNPFSWSYLTAPVEQTPVWGPFSIIFLVIFVTGFVVALGLNYDVGKRFRENRLLYELVQRGASIAMIVFGIGLFFFMFRALHLSAFGLHMRIWLYLTFLIAVGIGAYFYYYVKNIYPEKVRAIEAARIKRRYLVPAGAGGSGNSRRRTKKKQR